MNPPDEVLKALVELVEGQRWTNSLQDLGTAIGALTDDQLRFKRNTDLLLKAILDRLANSGEWKLIEMCHRHELKYVVNTKLSCSHRWDHQTNRINPPTDTLEWSLPINCSAASLGKKITEAHIQEQIVRFNSQTTEVVCNVCRKQVQLNVFFTVPPACDPDFLTLVCNKPVSLKHQTVTIQFSRSRYSVKSVTHWTEGRRMGAVSREKNDGSWWWHGVVKSQALEHKYTEAQLESSLHFQDVVVLFAVRMGPIEEDVSQEGTDISLGDDEVLQGDVVKATVEDWNRVERRDETENAGKSLYCTWGTTVRCSILHPTQRPSNQSNQSTYITTVLHPSLRCYSNH